MKHLRIKQYGDFIMVATGALPGWDESGFSMKLEHWDKAYKNVLFYCAEMGLYFQEAEGVKAQRNMRYLWHDAKVLAMMQGDRAYVLNIYEFLFKFYPSIDDATHIAGEIAKIKLGRLIKDICDRELKGEKNILKPAFGDEGVTIFDFGYETINKTPQEPNQ